MTLRLFCEEFCCIKFLNMFKIIRTTLCHLATRARKLRITGDCFKTVLRPIRDVCRQLSQNSPIPVRKGLEALLTNSSCQVFLLSERIDSYKYDVFIRPTYMYTYTVWTNFSF